MPPKISIVPIKPRGMLCNTLLAEQGLSERSIQRTKVSLFYFARQNIFNQICHSALKEKEKSFRRSPLQRFIIQGHGGDSRRVFIDVVSRVFPYTLKNECEKKKNCSNRPESVYLVVHISCHYKQRSHSFCTLHNELLFHFLHCFSDFSSIVLIFSGRRTMSNHGN